MRRMFDLTAVCVVLAVASHAYAQQCTCSTAKVQNGWCGDCKVGYVDAVKVKSHALFDALAGAEVKADEIKCASCKKAHASAGYCPDCRVGYVGKKKYTSRVAYVLAKGERMDPAGITCDGCKKNAADHGWCDSCKVGMVGNVAFKDKKAYDEAVEARRILTAAAESKCEKCAVAMVTDGECQECKVAYKDGKKTKIEKP